MKKKNPLFLRFECQILGFWLPDSDLDLASTEASFEIVSLEVIGSTLRVDTIRGKQRTWFVSIAAASPFEIGFTPMRGINLASSLF